MDGEPSEGVGVLGHFRSNAVAYLALFVALGGTGAYAADTVLSTDIKDGEVKNQDIANGAVGRSKINNSSVTAEKINGGAIRSSHVFNDSLTGDDLDESSLGIVPFASTAATANIASSAGQANNADNAQRLDNLDSSELMKGNGRVIYNRVVGEAQGTEILNIPFMGKLTIDGCDQVNGRVKFDTAGTGNAYFVLRNAEEPFFSTVSGGIISATRSTGFYDIQVSRNTGTQTRMAYITVTWKASDCVFAAHALQMPAL